VSKVSNNNNGEGRKSKWGGDKFYEVMAARKSKFLSFLGGSFHSGVWNFKGKTKSPALCLKETILRNSIHEHG